MAAASRELMSFNNSSSDFSQIGCDSEKRSFTRLKNRMWISEEIQHDKQEVQKAGGEKAESSDM